ncbi:hypothetical protein CDAR_8001 [Caerostris darwini]|uniref:Uncharacterized protein n=1 Tax=Caerostris darwini TaxID=1538125 RepID=A0AAV4RPJ0_9ARAC|nr:hypothetical protein CDAR_8001 [Caerostris darwini]
MVKSRFHGKLNLMKTPTQRKKLTRPGAESCQKEIYARVSFQVRFRTINFHFRDENSINYPNSPQSWHCTTNWLDVCITQRNKRLNHLYNKHNILRGPPPFITRTTPYCSQRLLSCGGCSAPHYSPTLAGLAFLEHNGWSNGRNGLCYLYWL